MTRISTAEAPQEVHIDPGHLSFSQLSMLHPHYRYSCARKWGYRYKLGLSESRSPALAMGSAMDDAINCYFLLRQEGVEPLEAGAKAADIGFASLQSEGPEVWAEVRGENPLQMYEAIFMSCFSAFLVSEGKAKVAAVQDKHSFSIALADGRLLNVLGYSDRIDEDGCIVDHKFSGSPRWDSEGNWHQEYLEEKRDQLLIYWLARAAEEKRRGAALWPPLSGKGRLVVTYHKLGLLKPQVQSKEVELEEGRARELIYRLAEAAETVQEGRLPLRPGLACRFCSFLAACREDQKERGTPFMQAIAVPF